MRSTLTVVIRVRGRLSSRLAEAFDGLTPTQRGAVTELAGQVRDQAQVFALLTRVRDLGLSLESATVVDEPAADRTAGSGS